MDNLRATGASQLSALRRRIGLALRWLTRARKTCAVVWLPTSAQDEIVRLATENSPDETGGVLLGYESAESATVVITHLVDAGPGAKRKPSEFLPDGYWQEQEIARIYAESGRRSTYLGDWHSHPAGIAAPSGKDHRTARKISVHTAARAPNPLMVIVAKSRGGWRIAAYRFDGKRLRHAKLEPYA
jgi:integrative and conjugative element protein (TIGR02256 family)